MFDTGPDIRPFARRVLGSKGMINPSNRIRCINEIGILLGKAIPGIIQLVEHIASPHDIAEFSAADLSGCQLCLLYVETRRFPRIIFKIVIEEMNVLFSCFWHWGHRFQQCKRVTEHFHFFCGHHASKV